MHMTASRLNERGPTGQTGVCPNNRQGPTALTRTHTDTDTLQDPLQTFLDS